MTLFKDHAMKMAEALVGHLTLDEISYAAERIEAFLQDPALLKTIKENAKIRAMTEIDVFASNIQIAHPLRGFIPWEMYSFQRDLLLTLSGNQYVVINGARQMGLSTCLSTYTLHEAIAKPNQYIVIGSHSFGSALDWMSRIHSHYEHLPSDLRPASYRATKSEMEFDNGSRIIATSITDRAMRGRSLTHLIIDNAAFISHKFSEEFWIALHPIISVSKPRIVIASNPRMQKGLFWNVWSRAPQNGFVPVFLPWHVHPERDETWANAFRDSLGAKRFGQEFDCLFTDE